MASFFKVIASERLKLSKSFIWLIVPVSPLIALIIGLLASLDNVRTVDPYTMLLSIMATFHAVLLLPLLTGIFSAFVCRYEHSGGGWKQLLTLPVSRTALYSSKFLLVALLLAATQLLFLGAVLIAAAYHGFDGGIPWGTLLPNIICGWLACLPLAALQLWVSVGWSSFAAPLSINVIFTLPNMLVVQSADYGPYYPWAQPTLAMMPTDSMNFGAFTLPLENLLITILGSFIVFWIGGLLYFNRKEV